MTSHVPLITVLMPVHNGAKYLHSAIESVLCQTMRDFELLIVDDASQDESSAIIRSYSDSRIRYIRSDQRLKLAGALNYGMSQARGELIARMDCDDICLSSRLALQAECFHQQPDVDICGTAIETFGEGSYGVQSFPRNHEQILAYGLFDNPFAHPSVMLRRSLFMNHKLKYDVSFYPSEDYELWIRALRVGRGTNLAKVLLQYRIHGASMTRAESPEMDAKACDIQRNQIQRMGINPTHEELLIHRYAGSHRVFPEATMDALLKLENWLLLLKNVNDEKRYYRVAAFRHVVENVWFGACYRCMKLGRKVLRVYILSRVRSRGGMFFMQSLIFLAAWLKHERGA